MDSTKQNNMKNDLRDGFTRECVAKKYDIDLKWLHDWLKTHNDMCKINRRVGGMHISSSSKYTPTI
jgi:hypothetical protein